MTPGGGASRPVVILCGFMGTGKSAAGRCLARLLGVPLYDSDEMIAAREGRSIAEIFERDGEAKFRELEGALLDGIDPAGGAVIATGGGMLGDEENFARLQAMGTMVHLHADPETIAARIGGDSSRPLAVDWKRLYEERRAVYARVAENLDTSGRTAEETAWDIAHATLSGARITHLRVDTLPLPGIEATVDNTRLCHLVTARKAAGELGPWIARMGLDRPAAGGAPTVFFLVPQCVEELYLERIAGSLDAAAIPWARLAVDDGDSHKTIEQATRLLDELAAAGASRESVVVTLGGGVTGDLGGLVASLYMRGVPWINIPTTLLAQVDAAIGGKTAVNTARAKNLVGTFYQPLVVLTDPDLLVSLPEREIAGGMAEVIKTAMIGDSDLFAALLSAARAGDAITVEILERAVRDCVRVKGRIVEADPYERDLRRVLNLGHTLGHALETALAYSGHIHGEAVALGLLAAVRVSVARGSARPAYLEEVKSLLAWSGLPVVTPDVDESSVRAALAMDKKRARGGLRFVMPHEPGRVTIEHIEMDELIGAMRD